ncbi:MAG: NAD(P)-binding domain-containing protein [Bacteroidales bacterium]|jgi:shikimate dehydrogenase|nr:NAD(P)-binding domain-containing protein [Bacteroidales bacterium]MCI1733264.1 NAD(P)-binding domain-containing protein [Bacteroidales bacterium]
MSKFALIGNPIKHSLSPALFKIAYSGNTDEYELIESQSVEEAMQKVHDGEYSGINVTAPFKESVMQYVTRPDSVTTRLHAANTLLFKGAEVFSYNTDYLAVREILSIRCAQSSAAQSAALPSDLRGFRREDARVLRTRPLANRLYPSAERKAMVIGVGGAGKAAALALKDAGYKTIIANRTIDKAKEFAAEIGAESAGLNEVADIVKRVAVIVYALPLKIEELKESDLSGVLLIEANYKNPSFSAAPNYVGGLEWLVNQAIPGFKLFTGREPSAERMRLFAESII